MCSLLLRLQSHGMLMTGGSHVGLRGDGSIGPQIVQRRGHRIDSFIAGVRRGEVEAPLEVSRRSTCLSP